MINSDAVAQALNVFMLEKPFKSGSPVIHSVGGLLDVEETLTRWPDETDVYKLAHQIEQFGRGFRLVCCNGGDNKWHPRKEKEQSERP